MRNSPYFKYNDRLGIELPGLSKAWDDYSLREREMIVAQWEQIRGTIPDRIKAFESVINAKQQQMNVESDFAACCKLNAEIADYASRINDLHLWFRLNQDVSAGKLHG